MISNAVLLCLGIGLLYSGSEWMVRGAAHLALSLSIRPIIVGLTIVAFATSAPELLVSLIAAAKGSAGVSLGNILGSNVANIGLVLGARAMVRPLTVEQKMLRREIPFLIGASGLFWLICLDGRIGRIDGIVLLSGLAYFLVLGIMTARNDQDTEGENLVPERKKVLWFLFLILTGMGGLVVGAHLVVKSALFMAKQLGLSQVFIGLSVVAVGTSLPELATSVAAGARGQHEISIGNVVGSNVFNICMVIGAVGLFNPMTVDVGNMEFEFLVMCLLSIILFIFCRTGFVINRLEGLFFMLCFFSFIGLSYWMAIKE
jgi:cation:H+ antiporter